MIEATLCHILDESKVLLLRKSIGLFGEGKWNAPGGKLKKGESPEEGVIREVFEETGLNIRDLKKHGLLKFYFGQKEEIDWLVYVYSTKKFEGTIKASEEGELKWFHLKDIPYNEMWEDDWYWLPILLDNKNFEGVFYFDAEGNVLIDYKI
ncbi:8-oxo-dGTP diphosphatase [Candidatus Bathyarchaeota archaeon]|nr:8-oxo-dGTP diphosphatase [Candidatus Bathyarchaeota archaeon]